METTMNRNSSKYNELYWSHLSCRGPKPGLLLSNMRQEFKMQNCVIWNMLQDTD